jgi:membrane-associated phospholipid phosphatase
MYDRGCYSSYDAYEDIQKNHPDFQTNIDDYLMFIPAVGVYGLNFAGVKGKNNFVDRSLIYLISISLASITNGIIKNTTNVLRPDGSDYGSLPSNHTTIAFISATFLHEEYKDQSIWYGIAGYSIATATGVLRMLNNRHWMSDVLVGAGIGILVTKVVYLAYPAVKNLFNAKDDKRSKHKLSLVPQLYPDHYGIYLHYRFN